MPINTINKSLKLNKCSIKENISTWIEQDIIVPDTKPDAVKIVNVVVTPYVKETEAMQDKVKVSGNINYFVIYKVADEKFNTRGLFASFPYTEVLEVKGANKDMDISIVPIAKSVIYSLPNERKIAIKSEIVFKTTLKKIEDVNLINKFDTDCNIECKMCTNNFSNIIETKKNLIVSKEDFMLPKEAEDFFEILNLETKIKNTEYKESYNKIMVKGDIELKIIYLAENSDDMVKKINTTIPFSAMIELENINDKSKFDIKYKMQDFSIKLNPDITSTKTMNAEYQIEVEVTMYEDEDIEYVEDFYSQTRNLNYDMVNLDAVRQDININKKIDLRENITNILPPDTRILDYALDTNYIIPQISNNNIMLDGNAKVILLLQDMNTLELESKTIDILVNQSIEVDNVNENSNAFIDIINENLNVVQNGQDIEVRITLEVNTNIEDTTNLNIINNIVDEDLDLSNLDSINIYIVKEGDTLWSIAKRYRTSVDKILRTNDIENADVISVGQKILIIR